MLRNLLVLLVYICKTSTYNEVTIEGQSPPPPPRDKFAKIVKQKNRNKEEKNWKESDKSQTGI